MKDKLLEIIDSDTFHYLYERWQDESEYEDIKDYGDAIAKKFGVEVLKSDENFRFTIRLEDKTEWEIGIREKNFNTAVGVYREVTPS